MGHLISTLQSEVNLIAAPAVPDTAGTVTRPSVLDPEKWVESTEYLLGLLKDFVRQIHGGTGQNDRLMLLEKILTWMATHQNDPIENKVEQMVVDILYKDLPHPPAGYVGLPGTVSSTAPKRTHKQVSYAYRSADGSNYNVMLPNLGQAGQPYTRSVPSTHPLPPSFLPDPSLVFDVLLKRDKFTPHPGGVSSLFFAFADLVIHSLFNTDREDALINNSSSYLDLSPLYGSSEAQVDSVRCKDGSGKLYEDVFADPRLLVMPPSVCTLLVILSRNHNYIADKILSINESGHYRPISQLDEQTKLSQDDEIFQRARLVNCGFFMQIILADYVGAILGLVRDGSDWRLKVREPVRHADHSMAPRGEGNVVSIEFNLMYRWHATLSEPDSEWITKEFQAMFPGEDLGKLTPKDLGRGYRRASAVGKDTREWVFGGLKRDEQGRFSNSELANILLNATGTPASAFKARGIPEAMKVIELMGIEQSRQWGTCSLNEFRRFMGLKPYDSFAEWNPDPEVHTAAQALYHDIENLELYVGMQAEESKTPQPGAGLCPGFTMSRAILSDAVCLTRGDRFMTIDFTPENFTAWGYQDCQIPQNDDSYGGMLTKLLFRHLPEYYPSGSAYAHFPFLVPESMKEAMEARNGPVDEYVWTRPVPQAVVVPQVGGSGSGALIQELGEVQKAPVKKLTGVDIQREPVESLVLDENITDAFALLTSECLDKSSIGGVGTGTKYVDVARDVINEVPKRWIQYLVGVSLDPDYAELANYIYVNAFPEQECVLFNKAKGISKQVLTKISNRLENLSDEMAGGFDCMSPTGEPINTGDAAFLAALKAKGAAVGRLTEDLAADLLGVIVATAPLFSRTMVRVVDKMLQDNETATKLFLAPPSMSADGAVVGYVGQLVDASDDVGIRFGMMSDKFLVAAAVPLLRTIITKCGLTRGPGRSGELSSLTNDPAANLLKAVYMNAKGELSPWPLSLMLQYESLKQGDSA